MKILNLGSLNIDYTYRVSQIVSPGETISSQSLDIHPGGKGFNQSIALTKAGAKVYHAGKVGEDGQFLIDLCNENKVNTDYLELSSTRTGNAVIQVSDQGQNSIILYPGANHCLDKEYLNNVLKDFSKGDLLLIQNEVNMLEYLLQEATRKQMRIFFNPSPFSDEIINYDLSKIDTFLLNEIEGCLLTGKNKPEEILLVMAQKYPASNVVLTLGEKGSYYQGNGKKIYQRPINTKVVDTTGAGDTFTGYFIAMMLTGKDIQEVMYLASKAASLAVSRKGAMSSIPDLDEVLNT